MFIGLLTGIVHVSYHTKCMSCLGMMCGHQEKGGLGNENPALR